LGTGACLSPHSCHQRGASWLDARVAGWCGSSRRFPTYLQLVAASLSSMVKDNSIPKYILLVKDMVDTQVSAAHRGRRRSQQSC
jgi:hypothetical protein